MNGYLVNRLLFVFLFGTVFCANTSLFAQTRSSVGSIPFQISSSSEKLKSVQNVKKQVGSVEPTVRKPESLPQKTRPEPIRLALAEQKIEPDDWTDLSDDPFVQPIRSTHPAQSDQDYRFPQDSSFSENNNTDFGLMDLEGMVEPDGGHFQQIEQPDDYGLDATFKQNINTDSFNLIDNPMGIMTELPSQNTTQDTAIHGSTGEWPTNTQQNTQQNLPGLRSNRTPTPRTERVIQKELPDDPRFRLDDSFNLEHLQQSTDGRLEDDPEIKRIIDSIPRPEIPTTSPSHSYIVIPTQPDPGSRPSPTRSSVESEPGGWEPRDPQPSSPGRRTPQQQILRATPQEGWERKDSDITDSPVTPRPQPLQPQADSQRISDHEEHVQPVSDLATGSQTCYSEPCIIGPPIQFYDQDCRNLGSPGFAWDWNPCAPMFGIGTIPSATDFFGYPKAVNCAVRPYGWLFDNMTLFVGATGFGSLAGPITEESYGIQEGINWAGTFSPRLGINAQVGVRTIQRTVQGEHPVLGEWKSTGQEQMFMTAGLFRRAQCTPFQWGVVYDWMSDSQYQNTTSLGQIRMECAGRTAHGCILGFRGTVGVNHSNPFEQEQYRLQAVDQFLGFIDTQIGCYTLLSFNAGFSGSGQAILGGSLEQPVSDKFSIKADLAYMIANGKDIGPAPAFFTDARRDSWGISISLVFHPHGGAFSRGCNPLRALFDVADNTSMFSTPVYR